VIVTVSFFASLGSGIVTSTTPSCKLAFQPIYWHMLLPGHDIPGITAQLSMAGKDLTASQRGNTR
jgi:hypothetical protein